MGMLTMIKTLPKVATKAFGKIATTVAKNKPQIMVYSGIAIATTGFVWAIISATKIKDTAAVKEAQIDELNATKEQALATSPNTETEIISQYNKDLRKLQLESAWTMFKLMGIPCILFAGGLALSLGGHLILVKRFGQLSTAFATLQQTFEKYRQMNIAEHGEECDKRYRYGVVGESEGKVTITDENGKEKQVKCKTPIVDPDRAASMYSFEFSESTSWRCPKDPVSVVSFLRSQEYFWNQWMKGNGQPVTLYMVLNDLGIHLDPDDPRNDYVMIAGWRPNGDGDNNIDFGVMRAVNKPALNMETNVVFLNFNCDGNLYHSTRYDKNGRRIC